VRRKLKLLIVDTNQNSRSRKKNKTGGGGGGGGGEKGDSGAKLGRPTRFKERIKGGLAILWLNEEERETDRGGIKEREEGRKERSVNPEKQNATREDNPFYLHSQTWQGARFPEREKKN